MSFNEKLNELKRQEEALRKAQNPPTPFWRKIFPPAPPKPYISPETQADIQLGKELYSRLEINSNMRHYGKEIRRRYGSPCDREVVYRGPVDPNDYGQFIRIEEAGAVSIEVWEDSYEGGGIFAHHTVTGISTTSKYINGLFTLASHGPGGLHLAQSGPHRGVWLPKIDSEVSKPPNQWTKDEFEDLLLRWL